METEGLKFHMRLRLYYQERNFGPGVAVLMELVKEKGSLSAACKELQMAYSKAWKIIHKAQEDLGFPLMEGKRGGDQGGRTVLTPQGEQFLEVYQRFSAEAEEAVEEIFRKYYH
ncbi:MAG: winged helix-turn-helix domain-containing protein [Lachnospiraceae bacterium]